MKPLSYVNVLSLDVVVGAVSCSLLLGKIWGNMPSWYAVALLGCVVWLIYTFDHLKDVYDRQTTPVTTRHKFHATHFKRLILASLAVLFVSLYLLGRVDEKVLRLGSILLVLVAIYFITLHFLSSHARYHKELVIAILYSAGVCIPPLAGSNGDITTYQVIHFTQLMGIALGNLLCFSLYEYASDRNAGFPSITQILPSGSRKLMLSVFLAIQLVLCGVFYMSGFYPALQVIFASMILVLLVITRLDYRFQSSGTFRLVGDAVFILPLIYVLID